MGNKTHAIQIFEELAQTDPNDTEALAAVAGLHKSALSSVHNSTAREFIRNVRDALEPVFGYF